MFIFQQHVIILHELFFFKYAKFTSTCDSPVSVKLTKLTKLHSFSQFKTARFLTVPSDVFRGSLKRAGLSVMIYQFKVYFN